MKAPCNSNVTGALILVGMLEVSDGGVTPHFIQRALWRDGTVRTGRGRSIGMLKRAPEKLSGCFTEGGRGILPIVLSVFTRQPAIMLKPGQTAFPCNCF